MLGVSSRLSLSYRTSSAQCGTYFRHQQIKCLLRIHIYFEVYTYLPPLGIPCALLLWRGLRQPVLLFELCSLPAGFDPHDDSDYLTISGNTVYNNGNHGELHVIFKFGGAGKRRRTHTHVVFSGRHGNLVFGCPLLLFGRSVHLN